MSGARRSRHQLAPKRTVPKVSLKTKVKFQLNSQSAFFTVLPFIVGGNRTLASGIKSEHATIWRKCGEFCCCYAFLLIKMTLACQLADARPSLVNNKKCIRRTFTPNVHLTACTVRMHTAYYPVVFDPARTTVARSSSPCRHCILRADYCTKRILRGGRRSPLVLTVSVFQRQRDRCVSYYYLLFVGQTVHVRVSCLCYLYAA